MLRFYEIRDGESTIDVIANSEDRFVSEVEKIGVLRGAKFEDAQGVISSDGQWLWQIAGRKKLPLDYKEIELREILTEKEYNEIKEKLNTGGSIVDPEPENPENPGEIMGPIEMRLKINELSANVDELQTRNEFLEECLMEMSEIIYA